MINTSRDLAKKMDLTRMLAPYFSFVLYRRLKVVTIAPSPFSIMGALHQLTWIGLKLVRIADIRL